MILEIVGLFDMRFSGDEAALVLRYGNGNGVWVYQMQGLKDSTAVDG